MLTGETRMSSTKHISRRALLDEPRYSLSEADHLAGLTRGTARRWLLGYAYQHDGHRVRQPPVGVAAREEFPGASFLDLVELVAIGRLKAYGFALPSVRRIVENCRDIMDVPRPLVSLRFKTDGREIFVERSGILVDVGVQKRRQAWIEVLGPFLETLDHDEQLQLAVRWWPRGRQDAIVVDPEYGFGFPVVRDSGVRTEILLERFRAGDLPAQIARDFRLTEDSVERALQFEVSRKQAA